MYFTSSYRSLGGGGGGRRGGGAGDGQAVTPKDGTDEGRQGIYYNAAPPGVTPAEGEPNPKQE